MHLLGWVLVSCIVLGGVVECVTPPGYGTAGHVLTAADVATISADITRTFGLSASYGAFCAPCTVGDNMGAIVRLAFHDLIGGGGPNGLGGANGCNDPLVNERGLEDVIARFEVLQARYAANISNADLWILGANVAMQHASTLAAGGIAGGAQRPPATPGPLNLPFRYGRLDDATCSGVDAAFTSTISGGMNWAQLFAILGHRYGMTVQEAVAVMGAHALGRCERANSGFEGGWSTRQSSMTNVYYSSMGNIGWNQPNRTNPEWVANPGGTRVIMIGVDMDLLFQPLSNCPRFNSFTSCTQNTAEGNGEPAASVVRFANSMTAWYAAFTTAWTKMSEFNWGGKLAAPGSLLPGRTTTTATTTPTTPTATTPTTPTATTPTTRSSTASVIRRSSSTGPAITPITSTGGTGTTTGGTASRFTLYVQATGGCESRRVRSAVENEVERAVAESMGISTSRVDADASPDRRGRCRVVVTVRASTTRTERYETTEEINGFIASISDASALFSNETEFTVDQSEGIVDTQVLVTCADGQLRVESECTTATTPTTEFPVVGTLQNLIVVAVGVACVLIALVMSCCWYRRQRARGQSFCACCCAGSRRHSKTIATLKTADLASPTTLATPAVAARSPVPIVASAPPAAVELSAVDTSQLSRSPPTRPAPSHLPVSRLDAADDLHAEEDHAASTETTPISPRTKRTYMAAF